MRFLRRLKARFSPKLKDGYQDHIQVWADSLKNSITTDQLSDLKEKYRDVSTKKSTQNPKSKKKKWTSKEAGVSSK